MSYAILGVDALNTTTTSEFLVGTTALDDLGNEWLYVLAGTNGVTATYVAFVDELFGAVMITTTNGTYGGLVGVPAVTIPAGSFGWVQRKGNATIRAALNCAADVQLATTATAGVLDDAITGGVKAISGIKLNAAITTAGPASAFLNAPAVGATLA